MSRFDHQHDDATWWLIRPDGGHFALSRELAAAWIDANAYPGRVIADAVQPVASEQPEMFPTTEAA